MASLGPTGAMYFVAGPRALCAIAGSLGIIFGVWHADRTWDEKGSAAYAKAKKTNPSGKGNIIPDQDLHDAFPFPFEFLIGWTIFAAQYLFPVNGSTHLQVTPWGVAAAMISLLLGFIASVPMSHAVMYRLHDMKKKLGMAFVLSWVGLTVSTANVTHGLKFSGLPCAIGAACIVASMKLLWAARKMGDSWEGNGTPNPSPKVYTFGGPLFVIGWFCFLLGCCTSLQAPAANMWYLTLHINLRTAVAFLGGVGMVPVVRWLDYAHDEGNDNYGKNTLIPGYGTDGKFFGKFLESPIPFVLAWMTFGLATFIDFKGNFHFADSSIREKLLFCNCLAQGIIAGVLIQTQLYKQNMPGKNFWSVPFALAFAILGINIGLNGPNNSHKAFLISIPGVMLIILGQITVFGDRKRGDYWMIQKKVNPNPIVYSYGEIYFTMGWILLSMAQALPNPLTSGFATLP